MLEAASFFSFLESTKKCRNECRILGSETGRGRFRDLDADGNIILKFFVKRLYGVTFWILVGRLEVLVNTVMNLRVLQSVQLSVEPTYRINKPAHYCVATR